MLFVFLQVLFVLKTQNLCTQQPLLSVVRAAGLALINVNLGYSVSFSQRIASQKLQAQSLSLSFGRGFDHMVHLWESWAHNIFMPVWFILLPIGKVIC